MTKESRSPNDKISARSTRVASDLVIRHLSLFLLLLSPALQAADNLGVLGSKPKWVVLEHYQETITIDEFSQLIQNVYCTHGIASDLIEINTDTARILANLEPQESFNHRFAKNDISRN